MRRQGLCFTCKGFREPDHKCMENEVMELEEELRCIEEEAMKETDLEMHMLHVYDGNHGHIIWKGKEDPMMKPLRLRRLIHMFIYILAKLLSLSMM